MQVRIGGLTTVLRALTSADYDSYRQSEVLKWLSYKTQSWNCHTRARVPPQPAQSIKVETNVIFHIKGLSSDLDEENGYKRQARILANKFVRASGIGLTALNAHLQRQFSGGFPYPIPFNELMMTDERFTHSFKLVSVVSYATLLLRVPGQTAREEIILMVLRRILHTRFTTGFCQGGVHEEVNELGHPTASRTQRVAPLPIDGRNAVIHYLRGSLAHAREVGILPSILQQDEADLQDLTSQ